MTDSMRKHFILKRNFPLKRALLRWPQTFEIRDHCSDVRITQLVGEWRHALGRARPQRIGEAVADDFKEHAIWMMPCVAAAVVRRWWEVALRIALLPVRRAFCVRAVTIRALHSIDFFASTDLRSTKRWQRWQRRALRV